jgi:putative integral membrane protein (TIGR02587 family)
MPADEIVGKIAIQAVPASIGALLARSQLGGSSSENEGSSEGGSYLSEIFLMGVGALFLGLNVAPTDEMVLISYKMTEWHGLALLLLSLLVMHGFIFAVEFHGAPALPKETPWWSVFLRFTIVGYAVAVAISLYVLWTFGRIDGVAPGQVTMSVLVLGFPASIGAAAARLII